MDGSSLLFIVMPIFIPLALLIAVALPFIANRSPEGRHRNEQMTVGTVAAEPEGRAPESLIAA